MCRPMRGIEGPPDSGPSFEAREPLILPESRLRKMDMLLLAVAAGAIAGGFVQGLSGFAFGLVAMSFWAWSVEPQMAAAMSVFGGLCGQVIAAISVRRIFNPRAVGPYLIGGLAGLPIGITILPLLDIHLFRTFLGSLLVLWTPLMLFAHKLPRITVGRWANAVIGITGGIISPLGGYNGAVLTIWGTLRGLAKDPMRNIIQNFNLGMLSATMVAYLATGIVTSAMIPMFAIVAPAMIIPTVFGTRLYIGISETTFRRIILSLLFLSGVALLTSSLPQVLSRL